MKDTLVEKLWKPFLKGYFENVVKHLPQSYRAKQLNNKGMEAMLVDEFETMFLKEPFTKAVEKAVQAGEKRMKDHYIHKVLPDATSISFRDGKKIGDKREFERGRQDLIDLIDRKHTILKSGDVSIWKSDWKALKEGGVKDV